MFINPHLHRIDRLYQFFIKIGSNVQSLFLFYMRVTWGHQFFLIGLKKLYGIQETAHFFSSLHIPHPFFHAYLVGWTETLCGLCIFLGFASRIAAIPLIIITLTALSLAHSSDISNFQFLLDPLSLVKQPPYPFLITAILMFCFGPGRISIDAWIKRWASQKPTY